MKFLRRKRFIFPQGRKIIAIAGRLFLTILAWLLIAPWVAAAANSPDASAQTIFRAMQEEMDRSLSQLKLDVFSPPYFINYQVRHRDHVEIAGSFGSLVKSQSDQNRTLFVEVRIGDSEFDSSMIGSHTYPLEQIIPLDDNIEVLRRALWYETDLRYKQAIMNFLKKKGRMISGMVPHALADFSKGAEPVYLINPVPEFRVDIAAWENLVREVSSKFREAPEIEKSIVKINADRITRYYYDSENNTIRDTLIQYEVTLEAWTKTESGSPIHDVETQIFTRLKNFPSREKMERLAEEMIAGVTRLRAAPKAEPYVGPAILAPDATAVLFHEALGHRLEGDRLRNQNDGKTFIKKIGQQILPEFLSVTDNPRMKSFQGIDLAGHYLYDDQGQKSEEVILVDNGILKNFLLSRSPVLGFSKTNGHARSDGVRAPMSRMGNFIIRSSNRYSLPELKRKLIEEIKKQKKPYGLLVKKIVGGETQTQTNNFQVFKGKPLYLYRVYPEDGREELVRGVEFLGTPLSMIKKVMATGDDDVATNGFCGAESGILPVTSIAPSILLSEVELQTSAQINLRRAILPPPALPISTVNQRDAGP